MGSPACGACLALQKAEEALKEDYIRILPSGNNWCRKDHGSYSVAVRYKEQLLYPTVAGIVVAVGLSLWPAEKRGEFGYTRLPGVITSLDLEIILQQTPEALGLAPRIAFIQCVGSRDTVRGVPYCSRVCCFYVPRLANLIKTSCTGSEVDIFYLDRQHYESIYQASPPSCRYIRAMPGKVTADPESQLKVTYVDPLTGKPVNQDYDWVVLCPAILPSPAVLRLASLLQISLDNQGFIAVHEGVVTNQNGIVAAGACTGPMSIIESAASGQAAAREILHYLSI